mmetsp:Transcript_21285/g.24282  ORF Transcript_21285/g.24282 Transcript_21285/m.24282 type:complete len:427 (+) Transcript_21285:55-1335(+)
MLSHTSMFRRFSANQVKTILPPRTRLEVAGKAILGAYHWCFGDEYRKLFMKKSKNGIINNNNAFFQNGNNFLMAYSLSFGLYHELQDPLLKTYGFNAKEFMEGVKPALERFHDVEKNIDNRLFEILNEDCFNEKKEGKEAVDGDFMDQKVDEESTEENSEKVFSDNDNSVENSGSIEEVACNNNKEDFSKSGRKEGIKQKLAVTSLSAKDREELREIAESEAALMENDNDSIKEKIIKLLDWNWKDKLVSELMPMLSNNCFRALQLDKLSGCFRWRIKGIDLTYLSGSSTVENATLLSARVQVISKDDKDEQKKQGVEKGDFGNAEEEELEMKKEGESKLSVAAQIEVLYEIKYDVSQETRVSGKEKVRLNTGEFSERLVRVGVLEGFLHGGPDGDEVQWMLSNVREPWEIPLIESNSTLSSNIKN